MLMDRWDGVTALDAMREVGCMRLAARIADLEREGHVIHHQMVQVEDRDGRKVRVARYRLAA
jgi:hypothetical protein